MGTLGNYNAFVVSLTNLFQAALHLQRKRQEESQYISRIKIELEAASMAIAQEFQILVRSDSPGARLPETTINEAYDVLFEKLKALRTAGLFVESSIEVDIDFFAHIASGYSGRTARAAANQTRTAAAQGGSPGTETSLGLVAREIGSGCGPLSRQP
jgi:hypothetical protein